MIKEFILKNMKNPILLILLFIITGCATKKVTSESHQNEFYPLGAENAKFQYASSNAFVDHKDISKTGEFNGKIYQTRIIEYSWGKRVETFYRNEMGSVFYYDRKTKTENLIMPKNPTVGFKWKNSDNSWEYEIMELDGDLETPAKVYKGLLVMRARQLTDRDETKLTEYFNYYQRNVGKVASFGNGELMTYRTY